MNKIPHSLRRPLEGLAVTLVSLVILVLAGSAAWEGVTVFQNQDAVPQAAYVLEVLDRQETTRQLDELNSYTTLTVTFRAELLEGEEKGKLVVATQSNEGTMAVQTREVEMGDKVMVYHQQFADGSSQWVFADYVRTDGLLVLGLVFLGLLLLFGRWKGLRTILSLALTCGAVFGVFLPAVLGGRNIYLWSLLTCLYVTLCTLLLLEGFHPKTGAAVAGCLGGVAAAGLLTLLMDRVLHLTGMVDEDSVYLLAMNPDSPIDLRAVIFAGILIGALGAVMDVAISLSSALWEVKEQAPQVGFGGLCRSGFSIGRDMMGTMSNTLILAYIGSSLATVLLLVVYNGSLLGLLNREMIVVEILQALVGSIGLLLTAPLTTLISALLFTRTPPEEPDPGQGLPPLTRRFFGSKESASGQAPASPEGSSHDERSTPHDTSGTVSADD